MQAMYLKDGYANSHGLEGHYRPMLCREAKQLSYGATVQVIDRSGNVREARLNGKPKTWKRSLGCVLSLKYGLYEYFTIGNKETAENRPLCTTLVVRIDGFLPETPIEIVSDWVKEKLNLS